MESPIELFAQKFTPSGLNECWNWNAGKTTLGYGKFGTRIFPKQRFAHRIMWLFENGPIPEGMMVLHHCDNPICVNPNHLFLGTHDDNMRDKVRKGRVSRLLGFINPNSRLTREEILLIRKLRDEDRLTFKQIAKRVGCSAAMAENHAKRRTRHDV